MAYSWSDFAEYARSWVGKAPDFVYIRAAKAVVRDFCMKTQVWREEFADIEVSAGEYDAALTLTDDQALTAVVSVTADSLFLFAGRDYVAQIDSPTVSLVTAPSKDITLSVLAALMPSRDATSLPDFLYDAYLDDITDGVIANLRSQSGQSWYDPSISMFHAGRYSSAIARTRMTVTAGGRQNTSLSVKMRPFC